MKVFVSYAHEQGAWVWGRLVPVLKAGGTEVLIDRERFEAGRAVVGQMDSLQDQAERQLVCWSVDHAASDACRHEWRRALVQDPGFQSGLILLARLDGGALPAEWSTDLKQPLYIDLRCRGRSRSRPADETETRLLLTDPMRHSELWKDDEASRPRFDTAFWGEGGIERIHHEAAGWPHLVQLLAERAVYLVNLRGLPACTLEVLDEAIAARHRIGRPVLRQLVDSESRLPGEWEYLKGFRTHDFQEPPADEAVYQSLRRRLMVTEKDSRWRMRVPLMQRWLRERG